MNSQMQDLNFFFFAPFWTIICIYLFICCFFPLYGKVDLVDNVLYFHETNVTVQIILLIVKIGFDFFKKPVIVDLVMFLTGIRRFTQKHFLMQVTGQCIE